MGLNDLVKSSKNSNEKKTRPKEIIGSERKKDNSIQCPVCGSHDTEKKEYYYRCRNDYCDHITFIPYK